MKFTVDWLKQYTEVNITTSDLSNRLTMAGLEVEGVEELFADLDGVKVAEILSVTTHPDADRLVLCEVAVGPEKFQVVCGAPNAKEGLFTAIALPGVQLSSGLTIRKSKIRGQVSYGMLCSEKDLGISEEHSGIIELDWLNESGEDLVKVLDLSDTMIEVDLTPNRPDCASVIGIARESAAFCDTSLSQPVTDADLPILTGESCSFAVEVEDRDCLRYTARLLKNVVIAPSPWWLKKRLLSVGLRSINNVVDITNFVMLEYGQPLHAFDFKKLAGSKIVVRKPKPGETLTTLDGVERELDPQMLMICDAEMPIAVAGVMGGGNSEVDELTSEVLLESACFDPVSVRRTARNLNIGTDASYRFERGVDPKLAPRAMERAVRLLCEIAGAEVMGNGIDYAEGVTEPVAIRLRVGRTSDLLGVSFTATEITDLLQAIELKVEQVDGDTLMVTPSTFRIDLEREVDLVEEVARLRGYDEFPLIMPLVPMASTWQDPARMLRKDVAVIMQSLGFYEAINYSFGTPKHADMLELAEHDPLRQTVHLLNPLGEEQSVMRSMLLPGLLENVRRNVNHQSPDLRLFETGKCFTPGSGLNQPKEEMYLTAVISGSRFPGAPVIHFGQEKSDIIDIKAVVEALIRELRCTGISMDKATSQTDLTYCETWSLVNLTVDGKSFGHFAKVCAPVLKNFSIKQDVFFVNINLDVLRSASSDKKQFVPLPKFPSVNRDIAVIVAEKVGAGDILQAINEFDIPLVKKTELFDIYRGDPIEINMKSVAVAVTYQSAEQTLDDETVDREHQKIIDMILTRFDGQLREV